MAHGVQYIDRKMVEVRNYILAHIDEDITPRSVTEHFGLPYNRTRAVFTSDMGESMSSMIRRLKAERTMEGRRIDR